MTWEFSMSRVASVPRIAAVVIAIAAAAVFCSLELAENPSGQFSNPRNFARNTILSFTLHTGITKDE
jgi:hypothetical protein